MIRACKLCTVLANDCFRLNTKTTSASDTISAHFADVKQAISFYFVREKS